MAAPPCGLLCIETRYSCSERCLGAVERLEQYAIIGGLFRPVLCHPLRVGASVAYVALSVASGKLTSGDAGVTAGWEMSRGLERRVQ